MISTFICLLITATFCYCLPTCNIQIVESMPQYLTFESTAFIAPPLWKAWRELIRNSKKSIRINSFYWSMLGNDSNIYDNSSAIGSELFTLLLNKSKSIPIAINHDANNATCNDMEIIRQYKNIQVFLINVTRLVGKGIQHSKMIIGDDDKAYLGSANMDWRSLTQIKEMGAYFTQCPTLVGDLTAFWRSINLLTGFTATVPKQWPRNTWPNYNSTNPLMAFVNGVPMALYTATSPTLFNPPQRSDDLAAIMTTIREAEKYIYISVMDFVPLDIDYSRNGLDKYWPIIEDALISAALERGIYIRLLISLWSHSDRSTLSYLRSITALNDRIKHRRHINIVVKMFIIPAFNDFQRHLMFSRVSHSKYMVTDSTAYIGTSNWSGNYFKGTVGLSLIAKEKCAKKKCDKESIRSTLENVFNVDWNSIYAHNL